MSACKCSSDTASQPWVYSCPSSCSMGSRRWRHMKKDILAVCQLLLTADLPEALNIRQLLPEAILSSKCYVMGSEIAVDIKCITLCIWNFSFYYSLKCNTVALIEWREQALKEGGASGATLCPPLTGIFSDLFWVFWDSKVPHPRHYTKSKAMFFKVIFLTLAHKFNNLPSCLTCFQAIMRAIWPQAITPPGLERWPLWIACVWLGIVSKRR